MPKHNCPQCEESDRYTDECAKKLEEMDRVEAAENAQQWHKSVDAEQAQRYQMSPEELEKWYLNMAAYYRDEAAKLSASVTDEEKAALNEQATINQNLAQHGSFLPDDPTTFRGDRPGGTTGYNPRVGGNAKSFTENQSECDAWLSSGPNGHVGGIPRVYSGDVSGYPHGLVGGKRFKEMLNAGPRRIREKEITGPYGTEIDPIKQFKTWQKEPLENPWPLPGEPGGPEIVEKVRVGTSPESTGFPVPGSYGMPTEKRFHLAMLERLRKDKDGIEGE